MYKLDEHDVDGLASAIARRLRGLGYPSPAHPSPGRFASPGMPWGWHQVEALADAVARRLASPGAPSFRRPLPHETGASPGMPHFAGGLAASPGYQAASPGVAHLSSTADALASAIVRRLQLNYTASGIEAVASAVAQRLGTLVGPPPKDLPENPEPVDDPSKSTD